LRQYKELELLSDSSNKRASVHGQEGLTGKSIQYSLEGYLSNQCCGTLPGTPFFIYKKKVYDHKNGIINTRLVLNKVSS
jgi:hypothetical protein